MEKNCSNCKFDDNEYCKQEELCCSQSRWQPKEEPKEVMGKICINCEHCEINDQPNTNYCHKNNIFIHSFFADTLLKCFTPKQPVEAKQRWYLHKYLDVDGGEHKNYIITTYEKLAEGFGNEWTLTSTKTIDTELEDIKGIYNELVK